MEIKEICDKKGVRSKIVITDEASLEDIAKKAGSRKGTLIVMGSMKECFSSRIPRQRYLWRNPQRYENPCPSRKEMICVKSII